MTTYNTRLWRFAISGIAATLTHTLIAYWLVVRNDVNSGIANGSAFLIATLISYLINTYWTFETCHSFRVMMRFALVASAGSILSGAIASLLDSFGFAWWQAVLAIIVSIPILTWLIHQHWTYR